jgi:beta-hydroxyacyl-ACP dehydratase FabZ
MNEEAVTKPLPEGEGGQLDIDQILDIMPHRYPFLLIDRVLKVETGKSVVGIKNVTMNEPYFQGHFPSKPVMPGVLQLEALAQLSGILLVTRPEDRGKLAYFLSIDKAKFRKAVRPGDQLRLESKVMRLKGRILKTQVRALVKDEVACEAEMMFQLIE